MNKFTSMGVYNSWILTILTFLSVY
jgi:hypothetical protein